jgi:ribonuclease G
LEWFIVNEIYIDVGMSESRVVVVDEGDLAEIHIERQSRERTAGNIYKGKVENVLPGMQAAFVNIGLEKNAFLYIKDAVKYKSGEGYGSIDDISISSVLKQGDEILVQVSKEPVGSKGARVTTHVTLPGRYLVLMPNADYIGISHRIVDGDERERLKNIVSEIKPCSMGLIVRTEAEGRQREDFIEDIEFQLKLWDKIKHAASIGSTPSLIHKDFDLVYRSIRDLFNRDTGKIVINDSSSFENAHDFLELLSPGNARLLEYYDGSDNIMDFFGVEDKIKKALSRKVWLKCGGYIIIDQTEALTIIDVNTGKFTGGHNLSDTVLHANMEAAREIARQLRLRDIGGIIVIDFIDMGLEEHRTKVVEALKDELKRDRTKTNVFGITQLGLVEMTRKKAGKRLSYVLQKQCPLCSGSGRILDEESMMGNIWRKIEHIFKESEVPAVLVEVSDPVAFYLRQSGGEYIKLLENRYKRKIFIKGAGSLDYLDVNIKYLSSSMIERALKPIDIGDKVDLNIVSPKYLSTSSRYTELKGRVCEIEYDGDGSIGRIIIDEIV